LARIAPQRNSAFVLSGTAVSTKWTRAVRIIHAFDGSVFFGILYVDIHDIEFLMHAYRFNFPEVSMNAQRVVVCWIGCLIERCP
jgi:hypothetical protein